VPASRALDSVDAETVRAVLDALQKPRRAP
jgi:hypothetical protein